MRLAPWLAILGIVFFAAPLAETPPRERETIWSPPTIVLTGDILLAGAAERLIAKEGPAAPFAGVQEVLRNADLAIGNLECPLAAGGKAVEKQFTFLAHPDTSAALVEAGFDVLTLANNHALDYGRGALLETLATLREHGMLAAGAGENTEQARRHLLLVRGSPPVKIAVLAFSNVLPTSFYASPNRPGTNPAWPQAVAASVAAARRQADVVITVFHWGQELSPSPSAAQRHLAAVAVDAGADLVAGHHPHLLQGIEVRGHALIAYSLGNFLFPSRGQSRRTVMLRYMLTQDGGARAEVIPCAIDGFRPRVASDKDRADILTHLASLSRWLGTDLSAATGTMLLPPPTAAGQSSPAVAVPVDNAGRAP